MELTFLTGTNWDQVFSLMFLAVLGLMALYSWATPQGGRAWWLAAGLAAGMALAALQSNAILPRMLWLDGAGLAAAGLVWLQPQSNAEKGRAAARLYLALTITSALCVLGGLALGGVLNDGSVPPAAAAVLAVALVVVGFALKLALVPFYFWLPAVAETASPMTLALIIGVVDMAALTELAHLRLEAAWMFEQHATVWLALALLSMFGGALLALVQTDLKRMLAFSTIDDLGYLLLGIVSGSTLGLSGAMLGALSHTLFKVLLFASVGLAEHGEGRSLSFACCGLAGRYPVAGAAFIIGALGMIGVPPLFGFTGRWRLYLAGISWGGPWLGALMMCATALALLYYVRAIHTIWLGEPADTGLRQPAAAGTGEPRLAALALYALMLAGLVLGLFPAWLLAAG